MGKADQTLQHNMMVTYLHLLERRSASSAICFYTDSVKLVVDGSSVLDILNKLEEENAHLIIKDTCLNYFNLQNKARVGIIGGITDIIEAQWGTDKVITL